MRSAFSVSSLPSFTLLYFVLVEFIEQVASCNNLEASKNHHFLSQSVQTVC